MNWPSLNTNSSTHVFFRIIVKCILQDNKMNLPLKFVGRYGHELGHEARLIVPKGRVWKIELGRENNEIYLGAGLENFFQFYSICYRCLLIMKYKGNSNFDVQILDTTHSEIDYPQFAAGPQNEQQDEIKEEESVGFVYANQEPSSSKQQSKRRKTRSTTSTQQRNVRKSRRADVEAQEEIFVGQRYHDVLSKMSKKPKKLAGNAMTMKPRNPSFLVIMTYSFLRIGALYVPSLFAKRYMMKECCTKIKVNGKKQIWKIKSLCWCGSSLRLQGLTPFYNDNGLKHGDVCLFELLQGSHVAYKVSIFRI